MAAWPWFLLRSGVAVGAALAAGILLWCLYFALGFRAFSRGVQANGLGLVLTLVLPLVATLAEQGKLLGLAAILPPGSIYAAAVRGPGPLWSLGPIVSGALALVVGRIALARCEP